MLQPEGPVPRGPVPAILRHPQVGVLPQPLCHQIDLPLFLQCRPEILRPVQLSPPLGHFPFLPLQLLQPFFPVSLFRVQRRQVPRVSGIHLAPLGHFFHGGGGHGLDHRQNLAPPFFRIHLRVRLPSADDSVTLGAWLRLPPLPNAGPPGSPRRSCITSSIDCPC